MWELPLVGEHYRPPPHPGTGLLMWPDPWWTSQLSPDATSHGPGWLIPGLFLPPAAAFLPKPYTEKSEAWTTDPAALPPVPQKVHKWRLETYVIFMCRISSLVSTFLRKMLFWLSVMWETNARQWAVYLHNTTVKIKKLISWQIIQIQKKMFAVTGTWKYKNSESVFGGSCPPPHRKAFFINIQ